MRAVAYTALLILAGRFHSHASVPPSSSRALRVPLDWLVFNNSTVPLTTSRAKRIAVPCDHRFARSSHTGLRVRSHGHSASGRRGDCHGSNGRDGGGRAASPVLSRTYRAVLCNVGDGMPQPVALRLVMQTPGCAARLMQRDAGMQNAPPWNPGAARTTSVEGLNQASAGDDSAAAIRSRERLRPSTSIVSNIPAPTRLPVMA